MTVPLEDKELLIGCASYPEFAEKLSKKYEGKIPSYKIYNRSKNLWGKRQQHIAEVREAQKANHTIMIPAQIKNKSNEPMRGDPFPDVGETLIKILHEMKVQTQLISEQNAMFQKLAGAKI